MDFNIKKRYKYPAYVVITVLVFLFIIYYIYGQNFLDKLFLDFRFYQCLDFLQKGDLYNNLDCWHGPIIFLIAYLFKLIFGNFFVLIPTLLLNIISLFLINKIIKKVTGKEHFFILLVIYSLLVFPTSLKFFESILGMTFLLAGIYFLFYLESKYRNVIIAGLFFSFSILSKHIVIIPILILIFFYCFYKVKEVKLRPILQYISNIKIKILLIVFIIFITNLLSEFIFPGFLKKVYFAPLIHQPLSPYNTISSFLEYFLYPDLRTAFLVLSLILSFYIFLKLEDKYSIPYILSFIFMSIVMIRSFSDAELILQSYHYYNNKFLLIIPFFVVSLVTFIDKTWTNKHKFLTIILLLVLLFPAVKLIYLDHSIIDLQDEVHGVLKLLPQQKGDIVSDKDRLSSLGVSIGNQDIMANYFLENEEWAFIEKEGIINLSKYREEKKNKIEFYRKKLINGDYSLIMVGPAYKDSDVYKLIESVNTSLLREHMFCRITIPSLEDPSPQSRYYTTIYFKESRECDNFGYNILLYYKNHFKSMCDKDELVINKHLTISMRSNDVIKTRICENGGTILSDYTYKRFKSKDAMILGLLIIIISVVWIYNSRKRELKKIDKIVIILLIVGIVVFSSGLILKEKEKFKRQNELIAYYEVLIKANQNFTELRNILPEYPKPPQEFGNIKECLYSNTPTGLTCHDKDDCITKFNKLINDYLVPYEEFKIGLINYDSVECINSKQAIFRYDTPCIRNDDCKNAFNIKGLFATPIKNSFKCKDHFCITTKHIKDYYSLIQNETITTSIL